MSRLPESPFSGLTPSQIATADRRVAVVRDVVDDLLARIELPPTQDRSEAIIKLNVDELTDAAMTICHRLGAPSDWIDMAHCAIAGELLYRALEARRS